MRNLTGLLSVAFLMVLVACSDSQDSVIGVEGVSFGSATGPTPSVDATDPDSAEQGTVNLDVRVLGNNFDEGSTAKFTGRGGIKTNATRFVNRKELVANIDVADDADLGLYDVTVTNSRGKKGTGTELFAVVSKGGDPGPPPPPDAFPTKVTFRDALDPSTGEFTDNIRSDFALRVGDPLYRGPAYEDGVCGVVADLGNFEDARMDPDMSYRKGRHRKTCGDARALIIERDEPADDGELLGPRALGPHRGRRLQQHRPRADRHRHRSAPPRPVQRV
jgi:hypothetical protein